MRCDHALSDASWKFELYICVRHRIVAMMRSFSIRVYDAGRTWEIYLLRYVKAIIQKKVGGKGAHQMRAAAFVFWVLVKNDVDGASRSHDGPQTTQPVT